MTNSRDRRAGAPDGRDASLAAGRRTLPGLPTLPALTSLRFFAAFWVLGFHALPRDGASTAWSAFWSVGWMGVTFFFVLSGFILTYTYGGGERVDVRRFWVARFARVYPLYLFAMLFAVPQLLKYLQVSAMQGHELSRGQVAGVVVTSLAMVQSWFGGLVCVWNCPSWSLSNEAFFYAMFPLALPLAAHRRGRAVLLAATVGGLAFLAWGAAGAAAPRFVVDTGQLTVHPLARLPEFLLGVWLGGMYLARRPSWRAARGAGMAAAAGIVALATFTGMHPATALPNVLAAPLMGLLIFAAAASAEPDRGLLAAAPLVLLGEASYALYMLHGPLHGYVLAAMRRVAPALTPAATFIVYVIASIALAIGSFRWLERPMRAWIRGRFDRAAVSAGAQPGRSRTS